MVWLGADRLLTVGALLARHPLVASGCAIGGALSVLHFKWLALFLTAVVDPARRQHYSRVKKIALAAYLAKVPHYQRRGVSALSLRRG